MKRVSIVSIIKTSIITAFTIATALIWKDVIIEIIEKIVPSQEELMVKFFVALVSTIFLGVVLYLILKTEAEAEGLFGKLRKIKKKW